jgi:hypothetical protein
MVALPGTTGTTGTNPGTAGAAKPRALEKKVPLKDGPAESGGNLAPGGGFWDGHRDTVIEENAADETGGLTGSSPISRAGRLGPIGTHESQRKRVGELALR